MKTAKRGRPPKQLPPQVYPEMSQKEYQEISAGVDRLKGSEIIAMFNNQRDFLELCHRGQHFPKIFDRFCWRLQYILGEIFLYIQNTLHELQYLENAYMLKVEDIRELACCLIDKAKQPSRDKEFAGLRGHFEKIFTKDHIGQYSMVRLYGICLKIWKPPLAIDVSLTYERQGRVETLIAMHKEVPIKVQELSFQEKIRKQAREMMAELPAKLPSLPLPLQPIAQDDIIHLDKSRIAVHRQPGKCYNRNWSLQVEGSLCKLYARYQTSQQAKEELQKLHGKDARWSSAYQIDSKMHGIAAKVFKKLASLQTSNPNIVKFRTLRSHILSSDELTSQQRRALFKTIGIIYEAMIDAKDPAKKQTISQKILEVVQLCKLFEAPLK